ncbi:MAG: DUF2155 domain-containing protein, partial [Methylocystis sp.]
PTPEAAKADAKQEAKRIFSGWMFAASPGLHGVEHPVYDVWLVDCKGGKDSAAPPAEGATAPAPAAPAAETTAPPETGKKRRSRRVEPTAPPPMENQPIGPADQAAPAPMDPEAGEAPPEQPPAEPPPRRKKRRRGGGQAAPPVPPADVPF